MLCKERYRWRLLENEIMEKTMARKKTRRMNTGFMFRGEDYYKWTHLIHGHTHCKCLFCICV